MTRNIIRPVAGISMAAGLLILAVLIAACNKKSSGEISARPLINQAREWFQNTLVENEKTKMAQSFSVLPSDDPARRFARLRGLNQRLSWSQAREYAEGIKRYIIVPVEQDRKPLDNKNFEAARSLAFLADADGKFHLTIIEMFSSKGRSLGENVSALAQAAYANKLSGKNTSFQNAEVSVIFYNENYQQESSFQFNRGKWESAKVKLVNQNGAPRNRSVPLMLGRTTCQTCQTWYLVGFWYDLHTGEILDYEILDEWDECIEIGGPPEGYGGGPGGPDVDVDCQAMMQQLEGSAVSVPAGTDQLEEGPVTRTRMYHWEIYRQNFGLWRFISHEKGVHVKTNDPLHPWKWQSLTHVNVSREGVVIFGTVECTVNTAEPYLALYTAGMQLNFTISASAVCRGFPLNGSANYTSAMVRTVDDLN